MHFRKGPVSPSEVWYAVWDDSVCLSCQGPNTDCYTLEREIPEKLNTHTLFPNQYLRICDLPNRFFRVNQESMPSLLSP